MKFSSVNIIVIVFVCFIFQVSCKQIDLTEQSISIPNYNWQSSLYSKSSFEIKDTTALYKVYIVMRHKDDYEYSNIWLNVGLQQEGEQMKYQKLNLSLANDAKGWEGIGMNDIWEVRKEIARIPLKKGRYNTSVGHIMRQNPLQHVMIVGVRVEKVTP
jgi:gliding motility-associated lipoprotein GldH